MAHNLNFNELTGQYSLMSTKTPWHNLGQVVESAQTSEEAIKLAGLDFEVVKKKVYIEGDIEIPRNYATVRTDLNLPLGVVGEKYHVLQNSQAFKFIDDIVGKQEAIFESAGAFGNGETIFLSCKLPNKFVVGGDDVADMYFLLTNNHTGSSPIEMMFTPQFVLCENTFRMAMRNNQRKQKVRHTANLLEGMRSATDLMGITRLKIDEMVEVAKAMTKVHLRDEQVRKLIEMAMKPSTNDTLDEEYSTRFTNMVDDVMQYTLSDSAQLVIERKNTLWGAVQGVNGYYNNVKTHKSLQKKVDSLIYNTGFKHSNNALDLGIAVLNNQLVLN